MHELDRGTPSRQKQPGTCTLPQFPHLSDGGGALPAAPGPAMGKSTEDGLADVSGGFSPREVPTVWAPTVHPAFPRPALACVPRSVRREAAAFLLSYKPGSLWDWVGRKAWKLGNLNFSGLETDLVAREIMRAAFPSTKLCSSRWCQRRLALPPSCQPSPGCRAALHQLRVHPAEGTWPGWGPAHRVAALAPARQPESGCKGCVSPASVRTVGSGTWSGGLSL